MCMINIEYNFVCQSVFILNKGLIMNLFSSINGQIFILKCLTMSMRTASLSLSDFPPNVPTEFTITDERLQEIKEKKIQQ